jgi:hypothetical protein
VFLAGVSPVFSASLYDLGILVHRLEALAYVGWFVPKDCGFPADPTLGLLAATRGKFPKPLGVFLRIAIPVEQWLVSAALCPFLVLPLLFLLPSLRILNHRVGC